MRRVIFLASRHLRGRLRRHLTDQTGTWIIGAIDADRTANCAALLAWLSPGMIDSRAGDHLVTALRTVERDLEAGDDGHWVTLLATYNQESLRPGAAG